MVKIDPTIKKVYVCPICGFEFDEHDEAVDCCSGE